MSFLKKLKDSEFMAYLRLMRFDRPVGIWLLLFPSWWGILLASKNPLADETLFLLGLFTIGAVIMRSAGCVINDIIDRKFDQKVTRTKERPLASGRISLYGAVLCAILLLLIGLFILLKLNQTTQILGVIIIIPIILYPFMKRLTYFPQVFLGLTFNWGALMGWTAAGGDLGYQAVILYTACIFWTLGYDTIYGHQDKDDDIMLGLKSTSIKFGDATRRYLTNFYVITTVSLWLVGILIDIGIMFHVFLIIAAGHLIWQVVTLNIKDPDNCMQRFLSNRVCGLIITVGIVWGLT